MATWSELHEEFKMRTMRSSDLDLVVQNEVSSYNHPWNKRIFIDCLRAGYQCWVLASKDKIIGHGVMSVAIGECHLLTLCVIPQYQRSGFGKKILNFLLEKAARLEARVCFLEVRQSNKQARALYQSMGFLPVGERKNYYPLSNNRENNRENDRENAIIMSLRLPET